MMEIRLKFHQEGSMESQKKSISQLTHQLQKYKTICNETQKTLNEYRNRFFSATDAVPDPVVFYDLTGHVTYLNPAFTKVFGWKLYELLNKKIDFVPKEYLEETTQALKRVLAGEIIHSFETRRYTKTGNLLDILLSCATYTDDKGETVGSTVIYRDVTEKKKIEAKLLESEERYRSAMEAAADPIIVYDNEGRVIYFNPAFSRVFKWSLSERINRKMDDFVPEANWSETKKMIDMVIVGEFFSGIETARYDKYRNIIPVSISGSTYKDKQNRVMGSVISLQDITERKKAEEAVKQEEKLKGVLEMAGAVCHELSQPAMIIDGYIAILLMSIEKDSPLFEKIDKIRVQVERIAELTQKLMNITKYETREYSKGKTIVDIDKASSENEMSAS